MTRKLRLTGLPALLAALFIAGPTFADNTNTDKADTVAEQLKALKTKLDEIGTAVADLKNVKTSLEDVKTEAKNFRTDHDVAMQAARRDIQELKDEVRRLKTELDSLHREPTSMTRQSGFAPPAAAAPLLGGRVELYNTWSTPVTIILNNRSYPLASGERRIETVPAGTFSFEVLGITGPNNVRSLTPGETYQIHIHPQL